jgi:uncharacterized protein DUF6448
MFSKKTFKICGFGIVLLAILVVISPYRVSAHCDALDGPVIEEAQLALEKDDVTPLLKWVTKEHENDIRNAFAQTRAVRTKGTDARELADRFFFETLVRVHRAGEGAPYTGLKPAGTIAPAIAAADKALLAGSVDELSAKIGNAVRDGIRKRFAEVAEKKKQANDSVEAGREFVEAYVEYVHFIEGIHNMVARGPEHDHGGKDEH